MTGKTASLKLDEKQSLPFGSRGVANHRFLTPTIPVSHSFLQQWISEVMHFCQNLPIILVGCKMDLRRDPKIIEELRKTSQRPVSPEEVSCLERIGEDFKDALFSHFCFPSLLFLF